MIYDTNALKSVNEEKELDQFFDEMENRFEYDTIAEATITVIAEQEANWNKLMEAVGISELSSVMEGTEVIYEGARLDAFIKKINQWFTLAKEKLAKITKAFLDQVDKFLDKIDAAVIKRLEKVKLPEKFTYSGYEFGDLKTPTYNYKKITLNNPSSIVANRDDYSKEEANKDLIGIKTTNVAVYVTKKYFGSEKKVELKNIDLSKQLKHLKNARSMKNDAKASYKAASKEIDNIIKALNKLTKTNKKAESQGDMDMAISIITGYYKAFSNSAIIVHSTYLRAVGAAKRQALSICTKAAMSRKAKDVDDKSKKPEDVKLLANTEGYVDTSTFLGAVEFI